MTKEETYKPDRIDPEFAVYEVENSQGEMVERECLKVVLTGEDYETAWMTAISSSEKTDDDHGKPMPYTGKKVERYRGKDLKSVYGYFGEIALAKIFGLTVDTKYRKYGDDQDFIFDNLTTDMKMAMNDSRRLPSILASKKGRKAPVKELYVMGFVAETVIEEYVEVVLVGAMIGEDVVACGKRPSKYSNAMNYDVYFTDTIPMRRVIEVVENE